MDNEAFKIIVLGDSGNSILNCELILGVGKTSLIRRFISDEFNYSYQVTVGVDFLSKVVQVDDTDVTL